VNAPAKTVTTFRVEHGLRAVVSGIGAVAERLAVEVDAQAMRRPMIVCGANVARSAVLDAVRAAVGREMLVYDGSRPHTPVETVDAGAASGRANDVDGIIAVGGSSAIDCAKGIAVLLATGTATVNELEPASFGRLSELATDTRTRRIGVVMVSTTLSFAEFLPFWGARHADTARKVPYTDRNCVDRTVFLDGAIAAHTPDAVWHETAVKALDDAIASFCRSGDEPFLDPILIRAMRDLVGSLTDHTPPDEHAPDRVHQRQTELVATWMTKTALPRLTPAVIAGWFSTAARHSLGAVYELSHGVGSCVALPHALRYHGAASAVRQAELAMALQWPLHDADAPLAAGLAEFLARLEVPTRLRDVGIDDTQLDAIVDRMLHESPSLGPRDRLRDACAAMV
jgi:alcohol dehydrogenase class IV